MSFVGKILVVVQMIMSVLFMAFAGAVFAIHVNWKAQYEAAQTQLDSTRQSLTAAQEELTTAKRDFETRLSDETTRANQFQARNTVLQQQVAALQDQQNTYEQQRDTQAGLAESKAEEARFRQEEAERQRVANQKLQARLDETSSEVRNLKDQLFTTEQDLADLGARYDALLEQTAFLERIVANEGLETDPRKVARMESPPPPVEGLVIETKKNRANRVQYVLLSIGSDDGLVENHELDVVRMPSETEVQSSWLGTVRVVKTAPDTAVAEVVVPAKNGIIQEGDNVTTKLR